MAGERDGGLIFVEQASAVWIVTVSSGSSGAMRSKRFAAEKLVPLTDRGVHRGGLGVR